MATAAQIKTIHTLKSKLKLTDEDYKSNLRLYGVESSADFTFEDASQFIENLAKAVNPGAVTDKKYYGQGQRGYNKHLTGMQADRIKILAKILEWDEARIAGFIERQTGYKKAVQMLTNQQASKVVIGMQRIISKGDKEQYKAINGMNNRALKLLSDATSKIFKSVPQTNTKDKKND